MKKKCVNYFIIALLLYMSGSIYAIQIYHKEIVCIFALSSGIIIVINRKNKFYLPEIFLLFCLIGYMGIVSLISGEKNINTYFVIGMFLVCTFLLANNISLEQFENNYIQIISILAGISLVSIAIAKAFPEIIWILPKSNDPTIPYYDYYNMGVHVFTIEKLFGTIDLRNNSIFWEAGVSQAFFNLGILFCLKSEEKIKKNWKKIILLAIVVLSTISITGYLLLGILLLTAFTNYSSKRSKPVAVLCIILASVPFYLLLLKTSFGERLIYYINNMYMLLERFGYGTFVKIIKNYDIKHFLGISFTNYEITYGGSANSILYYGVSLGFPILLLICYSYYKYINRYFFRNKILMYLFFVILFSTEVLLLKPIFMYFIFLVNKEECHERYKNENRNCYIY